MATVIEGKQKGRQVMIQGLVKNKLITDGGKYSTTLLEYSHLEVERLMEDERFESLFFRYSPINRMTGLALKKI